MLCNLHTYVHSYVIYNLIRNILNIQNTNAKKLLKVDHMYITYDAVVKLKTFICPLGPFCWPSHKLHTFTTVSYVL